MTEQVPSETFAVGEVAIFCRPGLPHFGAEVTILNDLRVTRSTDQRTGEVFVSPCYIIDGPFGPSSTGKPWATLPQWLRKKRLPREDLQVVRWNECPWQPENVNV